jgi:hypothetical protein
VNQPLDRFSVVAGARTTISLRTGPVIGEPSGLRATGTVRVIRASPGQHVGLPAEPDQGVALPLQPAVAGVGHRVDRGRVAGNVGVEEVHRTLVAAVEDVEQQDVVAAGRVGGADDVDVGDVLDHAAGVGRGEPDVLDGGAGRAPRVHLAVGAADDALERPDGAEAPAAEGGLDLAISRRVIRASAGAAQARAPSAARAQAVRWAWRGMVAAPSCRFPR